MFDSVLPFGQGFLASISELHGEIGFHYLVGLLKSVGLIHVQILFSLVIVFNYIMYYQSLKKLSPNFEISLLVLILLHFLGRDMGHIRQAIALSLSVFSIQFIIEKKPIYFVTMIFIATLFHTSALVFFPAYIFSHLKISKIKLLILLAAGFGFSFIPTQFKNDVFSYFTGSDIKYFDSGSVNPVALLSNSFIRRVIPTLIILLFYEKIILNIKYSSIVINLYSFGLFIALFFLNERIYFVRLVTYYLILEVIIYSYLFTILRDKTMKYSYALVVSFACIFFIINLLLTTPLQFTPYDNIIFEWLGLTN